MVGSFSGGAPMGRGPSSLGLLIASEEQGLLGQACQEVWELLLAAGKPASSSIPRAK